MKTPPNILENIRAFRARRKQEGSRTIQVWLTAPQWAALEAMCADDGVTIRQCIAALITRAHRARVAARRERRNEPQHDRDSAG